MRKLWCNVLTIILAVVAVLSALALALGVHKDEVIVRDVDLLKGHASFTLPNGVAVNITVTESYIVESKILASDVEVKGIEVIYNLSGKVESTTIQPGQRVKLPPAAKPLNFIPILTDAIAIPTYVSVQDKGELLYIYSIPSQGGLVVASIRLYYSSLEVIARGESGYRLELRVTTIENKNKTIAEQCEQNECILKYDDTTLEYSLVLISENKLIKYVLIIVAFISLSGIAFTRIILMKMKT